MAENLIFYLPRNTQIDELFSILNEIVQVEDESDPTLYAEVQILNSANKVKAILVFFGKNFNKISIYMYI